MPSALPIWVPKSERLLGGKGADPRPSRPGDGARAHWLIAMLPDQNAASGRLENKGNKKLSRYSAIHVGGTGRARTCGDGTPAERSAACVHLWNRRPVACHKRAACERWRGPDRSRHLSPLAWACHDRFRHDAERCRHEQDDPEGERPLRIDIVTIGHETGRYYASGFTLSNLTIDGGLVVNAHGAEKIGRGVVVLGGVVQSSISNVERGTDSVASPSRGHGSR